MKLRELQDTDLPELAELCRIALRDPLTPAVLARLLLAEPERVPEYELGLWDGTQLVAAVLGGVRRRPDSLVGGLRLLLVAPLFRRRGLATRLLNTLEQRMRDGGLREIRCGEFAPNYLWPGVDLRDTPAICLLQQRGYERFGEALNMDVDLTYSDWSSAADEERLAAAGWQVRRATAADHDALTAWVTSEFGSIWAWEAAQSLKADPITCFVALQAEAIGGFAAYDVSGLAGCFGPTGVAPAARGQAIGRVLLLRCFADLRARGHTHAEIGWVGPLAFYSTVAAARIGRVCWFMRRNLE